MTRPVVDCREAARRRLPWLQLQGRPHCFDNIPAEVIGGSGAGARVHGRCFAEETPQRCNTTI